MTGSLALAGPVMAQVLLTFLLLIWTGRVRFAVARAGRVRLGDMALSAESWPADVKKISNNLHNQFETPVLFYVLCGVATAIGATGTLMAVLAWGWFASRLVHTGIHVTSNRIRYRFYAFLVGVLILIVMWAVLLVRLVGSA